MLNKHKAPCWVFVEHSVGSNINNAGTHPLASIAGMSPQSHCGDEEDGHIGLSSWLHYCLTKNGLKYILNSNWKSSNFYILPKIHKPKKIIEKINESNNICLNMQLPEDLKGTPIVGGPNSPTQDISGLLEKILTPTVSCLKTSIKDDWDFIRKLSSNVDYPYVFASCDVVYFHDYYTYILH